MTSCITSEILNILVKIIVNNNLEKQIFEEIINKGEDTIFNIDNYNSIQNFIGCTAKRVCDFENERIILMIRPDNFDCNENLFYYFRRNQYNSYYIRNGTDLIILNEDTKKFRYIPVINENVMLQLNLNNEL
jgi:hypothetical protein